MQNTMQNRPRRYPAFGMSGALLGLSVVCAFSLISPAHAEEAASSAPLSVAAARNSLSARANHTAQAAIVPETGEESVLDSPLRIDTCRRGAGQLPPVGAISPFPVSLRLGAQISPRLKFVGGVDVTLSGVHIIPALQTRIDADAIVSANFKRISTLIPVTFDQIYSKGLVAGTRIYVGGGIGVYIGEITNFGGKVFVGGDFTSRFGGEVDLHFAGLGDPLVTAQLRVGL